MLPYLRVTPNEWIHECAMWCESMCGWASVALLNASFLLLCAFLSLFCVAFNTQLCEHCGGAEVVFFSFNFILYEKKKKFFIFVFCSLPSCSWVVDEPVPLVVCTLLKFICMSVVVVVAEGRLLTPTSQMFVVTSIAGGLAGLDGWCCLLGWCTRRSYNFLLLLWQ